jgi:hypothetical protein
MTSIERTAYPRFTRAPSVKTAHFRQDLGPTSPPFSCELGKKFPG